MLTPVESNDWRTEDAEFFVDRDGLKQRIGRDQFDALGISFTQILNSVDDEETITPNDLLPENTGEHIAVTRRWKKYVKGDKCKRHA